MRPLLAKTSDERRTASTKSPVTSVSAARKRLPKLWPPKFPSPRKRCRNRRESSVESSDRATMQLRMSPGGSICNSSRSRPELPPSSETVTMAESASSQRPPRPWSPTSSFRPESAVDRPVPPPMATSFRPRSRLCCKSFWLLNGETGARLMNRDERTPAQKSYSKDAGFQKELRAKDDSKPRQGEGLRPAFSGARGGENYPLELWVVAKGREVCVRLRADSQHGLEFDGASERFERRLDRAEPRPRSRKRVEDVRGSGVAFERALEQLLRGDEITSVQLDDAP